MHTLVAFDLDNTAWDSTKFGDILYRQVGLEVFGREIPMLTHPVDPNLPDKQYGKHSLIEIWRYKIEQVLKAGDSLTYLGRPLDDFDQIDFADLTTRFPTVGTKILSERGTNGLIEKILDPNLIDTIEGSKKGVITNGPVEIQEWLLQRFGYFASGIDSELCVYGKPLERKAQSIQELMRMYVEKFEVIPKTFVYVGDSPGDMEAVREAEVDSKTNHFAVGVLTGSASAEELSEAGAELILDNLSDLGELDRLNQCIRVWEHER